jgi:hypothetical protein
MNLSYRLRPTDALKGDKLRQGLWSHVCVGPPQLAVQAAHLINRLARAAA